MPSYYPLLLDAVFVLVVVIFLWRGAAHGFVRAAIHFIGYFAVAIAASMIGTAVAQGVYQNFLQENLLLMVENSLEGFAQSGALAEQLESIFEGLPAILVNILQLNADSISQLLTTVAQETVPAVALTLMDTVIGPTVIFLIQGLVFLLLFTVGLVVVAFVARGFTAVNRLPIIGPVNSFLGGAVGLLQAALLLWVVALAITVFNALSGDAIPWLATQTIHRTSLLRLFFETNPLLGFLGL